MVIICNECIMLCFDNISKSLTNPSVNSELDKKTSPSQSLLWPSIRCSSHFHDHCTRRSQIHLNFPSFSLLTWAAFPTRLSQEPYQQPYTYHTSSKQCNHLIGNKGFPDMARKREYPTHWARKNRTRTTITADTESHRAARRKLLSRVEENVAAYERRLSMCGDDCSCRNRLGHGEGCGDESDG